MTQVYQVEGVENREVDWSDEGDKETESIAPKTLEMRMTPIPPTLVQPKLDPETGAMWITVPLKNPHNHKDLVIRQGEILAKVQQIELISLINTPGFKRR